MADGIPQLDWVQPLFGIRKPTCRQGPFPTTEEIHAISTAEFPQHNTFPSPDVKHRLVVDLNISTSF